jgi:hypothetical protein
MEIPVLEPGGLGEKPQAPSNREMNWAMGKMEQASEKVSQGFFDVAKNIRDIAQKKIDVDNAKSLGNLSVQTEDEFNQWKAKFDLSNPDPNTYSQQVEKQWDKISGTYKNQAPNADVKDAFELRMLARKSSVMATAYHEGNKRFLDNNIADRLKQVEYWKKIGAETTSEADAISHKNSMIGVIRGSEGNLLTHVEAVNHEQAAVKDFDERRKKNLVARASEDIFNDPLGAVMQLETPSGGKYGELDELTRAGLLEHARTAYKQRQIMDAHELEKIKLENHNREENEIFDAFLHGKLKPEYLNNAKWISGDEKYAWLARMEARARQGAADVKTNFTSYINLHEQIGVTDRRVLLQKLVDDPGISENDKEKLYDKINGYTNSVDDHWKKKGYELFKTQLAPTRGLGVAESPVEQEQYIKASNMLDRKIEESKRSKQPITGEQIYSEAEKILPLFQLSQKQIMEIEKERLRSYKVGSVYTDANGKKAKYKGKDNLGNHQWETVK